MIACPSCATSYVAEPAGLQPDGRRARCRSVWRNEPSRAAPDALVAPWLPNPPAAPAQSPRVPAEVAAGEPFTDAPDVPAVGQEAAEGAPGELEPAEATGGIELDALSIVLIDLNEVRPPIDVDAEPMRPETAADHKDIETPAARHFGRGAEQRPHARRLSRQQSPIPALIVLDPVVVVGWRKDLARVLPQSAPFYATIDPPVNLRGLACDGASTRAAQHKGVQANIVNKAGGWSKCRD